MHKGINIVIYMSFLHVVFLCMYLSSCSSCHVDVVSIEINSSCRFHVNVQYISLHVMIILFLRVVPLCALSYIDHVAIDANTCMSFFVFSFHVVSSCLFNFLDLCMFFVLVMSCRFFMSFW
jgi:hypothetical protein